MKTARLEAFTDGVLAIVITITVLELKAPHLATMAALQESLPLILAYALSFVNVGLYWNNHHHLLQATEHIDGRVLWANLFMLFWLSLLPWVVNWWDETQFAALPTAAYGVIMGLAGIGYHWLEREIVRVNGRDSTVANAIGGESKGKISILLYAAGTGLAFVMPWIATAIYLAIAAWWIVPDRRIERELRSGND